MTWVPVPKPLRSTDLAMPSSTAGGAARMEESASATTPDVPPSGRHRHSQRRGVDGIVSATPIVSLVEHRVTVPRDHEIIVLRELSEEEATRIEKAADLITSVAISRPFRRLQGLSQTAASRVGLVEARDQPSQQELGSCRAVIHGLIQAYRNFVADASALIADREVSERTAESQSAMADLAASPEWKILAALEEPGTELVFDREHNLGILDRQKCFTVVTPLIARAFAECEETFTKLLLAVGKDVLEAATLLRRLHVECPQGLPALLDVGQLEEGADAESRSIVPRDLPLNLVYEALRLVRTAEKIAHGEAEPPIARPTVEDDDAQEMSAIARSAREDPQAKVASVDKPDGEEPAKAVADPAVVDLPGLISAAGRLNDALEDAWSGALDRALTDAGIEGQLAAVRAAIAGFQRRSEDDKVYLQEFPPGSEVIEQLEKDPQRVRERLVCAQLVAFTELLEKLQSVTRPTRVQVKIAQGSTEELTRFWESGAFGKLRGLLDLLRHLLEKPQPPEDERFPIEADRRFRLAHAAWHAGDPEGCLFHAACGLSRHLGLPVADLEASLPDNERRATASAGLRALTAQLRGEPALDLSTLTAPALADLAVELVMPSVGERGMGGDELYELLAQDLPHVRLEGE